MNKDPNRLPPVTLWGIALESLRQKKSQAMHSDFSRYAWAQLAHMPASQFGNILRKGKLGPSVGVVDQLLLAIGCTWHDWADAYDEAKRSTAQESGTAIPLHSNRPPKKKGKLVSNGHQP